MIIEDFGTLSNGRNVNYILCKTPFSIYQLHYGTTLVNLIVKDGAKELTSFLVLQCKRLVKLKTIHVSVAM